MRRKLRMKLLAIMAALPLPALAQVSNPPTQLSPKSTAQCSGSCSPANATAYCPSTGYVKCSGGSWVASSAPPSGVAGGGLGGTYPNPTVLRLTSQAIPPVLSGTAAGDLLFGVDLGTHIQGNGAALYRWSGSAWVPLMLTGLGQWNSLSDLSTAIPCNAGATGLGELVSGSVGLDFDFCNGSAWGYQGTLPFVNNSDPTVVSFELGVRGTATGKIQLDNTSNSHALTLQSGATASDLTLTLPTADGSAGNALVTDGAGNLSFSALAPSGAAVAPSGGYGLQFAMTYVLPDSAGGTTTTIPGPGFKAEILSVATIKNAVGGDGTNDQVQVKNHTGSTQITESVVLSTTPHGFVWPTTLQNAVLQAADSIDLVQPAHTTNNGCTVSIEFVAR